jgi:hypothetical protein
LRTHASHSWDGELPDWEVEYDKEEDELAVVRLRRPPKAEDATVGEDDGCFGFRRTPTMLPLGRVSQTPGFGMRLMVSFARPHWLEGLLPGDTGEKEVNASASVSGK